MKWTCEFGKNRKLSGAFLKIHSKLSTWKPLFKEQQSISNYLTHCIGFIKDLCKCNNLPLLYIAKLLKNLSQWSSQDEGEEGVLRSFEHYLREYGVFPSWRLLVAINIRDCKFYFLYCVNSHPSSLSNTENSLNSPLRSRSLSKQLWPRRTS